MNIQRFIRYTLPILPILCLGLALLTFVVSTDFGANLFTSGKATPTTSTVVPTVISGASANTTPGSPTQQPTPTSSPTAQSTSSSDREKTITTLKDLFIVVSTGIITLSSVYLGGFVQTLVQGEQEIRNERRKRTQEYKDYLNKLEKTCQLGNLAQPSSKLRKNFPLLGEYEISEKIMTDLFEQMPSAWELSGLVNPRAREAFDQALDACFYFIAEVREGNIPDKKLTDLVRQKCNEAKDALEKYENF